MTTPTIRTHILKLYDSGKYAPEIATLLDVSKGYVYGILREERPKRKRKPRDKTSRLREMILGLHDQGIPPARIAFLLQRSCTRQYVYRVIAD